MNLQMASTSSANNNATTTSEDNGAKTDRSMSPTININFDTDDGLNIRCPYIDFWEISNKKKIGRGTFGVVYKAVLRDKNVAVKEFDRNTEKKIIEREIKQLSRVKHPNIIALYGISSNEKTNYMIMEYAEGGSLHQFLHGNKKPNYSMAHAIGWARQCAEALAYMHAMKPKPLVHRDLKPLNLLLADKGRYLKICDFGTVTDLESLMTNNSGSAAWMAPEVFEGSKYTEKCDVYSWSIVLWEIIAREKPFKDFDNAYCILWKIHEGERPSPIPDLPEPIKQLMYSCWSKTPELRPSMQYVVEKLNILIQEFPGANKPLNYDFINHEFVCDDGSIGEDSLDSSNDNTFLNAPSSRLNVSMVPRNFQISTLSSPFNSGKEVTETSPSVEAGAWSDPSLPPVINIAIETSDGLNILCPYIDFLDIYLQEEVGRGTFGVVHKASWRDRYVAVKKFNCNSKINAFEIQIKQFSRVKHPNIIAFYGISSNEKSNYMIMEYAEGGSLHQFLHGNEKPYYSMAHALSWARQCAEAVAYMHAMKPKPLVHRDLKPLNLLLTDKGRCLKISGFGTSNDLVTIMTNKRGSAGWMAPEIFESSRYTKKCDVYSWGTVLWEMIAREEPFKDTSNPYGILWKINKGERPPPIDNLPESIEQLIKSCWDKKPELRPSMEYVVERMEILMLEFPGGDEPLHY
ncbi:mitogen-activated protein kinase kinase kinase 7-like [Lucilia sericata]|uniref:mitogen-activated protein kinase kinase kinase 7-like n=1 Tax=Lucilia sericata TaxID=13632 RepID=UPI0018A882C1|nr:mitogen-activated protein kinase kinase kinase 7-like [Lucilia sericata]